MSDKILAIVQTLAIILTLLYVGAQTSVMRKGSREAALSNISFSIRDVYERLLEQQDIILKPFGFEKEQLISDLLFMLMENRFFLWKHGLLDISIWEADKRLMKKYMDLEIMQICWNKNKSNYPQPFQEFIDKKQYMSKVKFVTKLMKNIPFG